MSLQGFENSFVIDERVPHYLSNELEKLLDLSGGEKLRKYCEGLVNVPAKLKKSLPVFDGEVRSS